MSYELLKEKFNTYRPQATLLFGFMLVFLVGFGVGRLAPTSRKADISKDYSNYSTKTPAKTTRPTTTTAEAEGQVQAAVTEEAAKDPEPQQQAGAQKEQVKSKPHPPSGVCGIKGNISAKGDKIYHIPGGAFFDRVKPEQCFSTETEAKAAGFRKSSR